jgi:hypothetical protein
MEPRRGARQKLKPRSIVNYTTSRWPAIHAYAECALCMDCFGDLMRDTLRPVLGRDICGRPITQIENGERAVCLAVYGTEHAH